MIIDINFICKKPFYRGEEKQDMKFIEKDIHLMIDGMGIVFYSPETKKLVIEWNDERFNGSFFVRKVNDSEMTLALIDLHVMGCKRIPFPCFVFMCKFSFILETLYNRCILCAAHVLHKEKFPVECQNQVVPKIQKSRLCHWLSDI